MLQFQEGFLFGEVIRRRPCQYKPYKVIDSSGTTVDISASSHQTELRFRDSRNTANDVLYLNDSTNSGYPWILHGAIGIKPSYINMYLRYPEGKELLGKFPEIDQIKPSSGDNISAINSLNSPYNQPTDFGELVIQPHIHVGAEYYNHDTKRKHQPELNLYFVVYWLSFYSPATDAELIGKMARGQVKRDILSVGFGDRCYELGGKLQEDWNVQPLKLEDARRL